MLETPHLFSSVQGAFAQETSFSFENGPLTEPPQISLATLEPTQVSREAGRFIQVHINSQGVSPVLYLAGKLKSGTKCWLVQCSPLGPA